MATKKVTTITSQFKTEDHLGTQVPVDPYNLGYKIKWNQTAPEGGYDSEIHILFNKGRYYETTVCDRSKRWSISWIMSKALTYGGMFVGSWDELETFVSVCNRVGIYCKIEIDWI